MKESKVSHAVTRLEVTNIISKERRGNDGNDVVTKVVMAILTHLVVKMDIMTKKESQEQGQTTT